MAKQNIQTRKDEVRFTTSDPKRMFGKFLAKRVLKTWKEDFIDESEAELLEYEESLKGREDAIRAVRLSIARQRRILYEQLRAEQKNLFV